MENNYQEKSLHKKGDKMDNITEDESKEIAKTIYNACLKRGIIFMPPAITDVLNPECIKKYRIHKKWIINFISDSIVEKMD